MKLEPPVAWETLCASNRSWQYHLQAWEAMSMLLSAHSHLGDRRYVDYCLGLAIDWIRCFPTPEVDRAFAWYDMAVGLRAYRLGYLLDVVARDATYDDDAVGCSRPRRSRMPRRCSTTPVRGAQQPRPVPGAGQLALARRFPELASMEAARIRGPTGWAR